jgi:collagen type VII alpha
VTTNLTCGCAGSVCKCLGVPGDSGLQGPPGLKGETGPVGPIGLTGVSIVSLTQTGVNTVRINLSNGTSIGPIILPQGSTGLQGPIGLQGPQGLPGTPAINGTNGVDGTSVIGVRQIGPSSIIFDFSDGTNSGTIVLPQGIAGPQGLTGPAGTQGTQGPAGLNGRSVIGVTQLNPTTIEFLYSDSTTSGPILVPTGPQGNPGISPSSGVATNVSVGGTVDVRVDGTTVDVDINNELTVDPCAVLTKGIGTLGATATVGSDVFLVKDAAGNCVPRFAPTGNGGAVGSGAGTTVSGGVVNIDVDGTTIKILADTLTVDPCEIARKGTLSAATPSVPSDKILAVTSAGVCTVRNMPAAGLSPQSGLGTSVVGGGVVNVLVDGTTVFLNANTITVDPCQVLIKGAAGPATAAVGSDKIMALNAAGNCVVRNMPIPSGSLLSGAATTITGGVINVDVDGTTVKIVGDLLTIDPCEVIAKGTLGAATAAVPTDKFLAVNAGGACVVRNVPAGSIQLVSGIATTISGGAINVDVDGTTIKVVGDVLTADACEALKIGAAGAPSAAVATDKIMAINAGGACVVRSMPVPAGSLLSGAATTITGGVVNVDVDGTTIKIVSDVLTVDPCAVVQAGAAGVASAAVLGDKVMAISAGGACVTRLLPSCEDIQDCVSLLTNPTGLLAYSDVLNKFTAGGTGGGADSGKVAVTNGDGTVNYVSPCTFETVRNGLVYVGNATSGTNNFVTANPWASSSQNFDPTVFQALNWTNPYTCPMQVRASAMSTFAISALDVTGQSGVKMGIHLSLDGGITWQGGLLASGGFYGQGDDTGSAVGPTGTTVRVHTDTPTPLVVDKVTIPPGTQAVILVRRVIFNGTTNFTDTVATLWEMGKIMVQWDIAPLGTAANTPPVFTSPANRLVALGGAGSPLAPVTATDPNTPITYTVTAGTLPTGVSMSTAGVFSPNANSPATFTVTATDSLGASSTQVITVNAIP